MKKYLKATVAFSALVCATTALAAAPAWAGKKDKDETGNENAGGNGRQEEFLFSYRGDIDPFRGDISPFRGDINPFRGDINPFYGDISPFWGDISPFWGDINPFHGDINPFHGDISPFWGDISPWYGDIDPFYGDINPFWGDIGPFWGDIGPFWGDVNAYWGDIDPFSDTAGQQYESVADQLRRMLNRATDVFGAAVEHETGQSIEDAVYAELLARYGVDLNDPGSLADMDAADRSRFFLDFYDSLMGYTGLDRVDHWMPQVNWTPALSQAANAGNGVRVGLLDFNFSVTEALNVKRTRGNALFYDFAHGAAVASLINAPLDGEGVMGIAPNAELVTYNPFDESLSTNFRDVAAGVERLVRDHARVINMSLGVPGTTFAQDWADVFSQKHVRDRSDQSLFVFAAGNDGYTQDFDVEWNRKVAVDNLLIVGSVDPNSNISFFSNRPGDACFTVRGRCQDGYRLMDRFLVAPGELIMVSDGNGGVIRQSGTSFAAPLVSGAAALVQGRWGWIAPRDVADVLLESARDLGEPGTDAVYGRGMLDIGAAMSPLDPDSLYIMTADMGRHEIGHVKFKSSQLNFFSAAENSVVLFEDLNDTFRDFVVSLEELDHQFTQDELDAALNAEQYLAEREAAEEATSTSFTDTGEYAVTLTGRGNLRVSAVASRLDPRDRASDAELGFQVGVRIADAQDGRELRFGLGEGALALSGQDGFGLFSDHRPETGGVNPVLGFASGGLYGTAGLEISESTRVTFGLTTNREEDLAVMPYSGEERNITGLDAYEAAAVNVTAEHTVRDGLDVSVSYTLLREDTGFMGAQGSGPLDLSGGAMTDAATFGVSMVMPMQVNLDASATMARTRSGGFGSEVLHLSEDAMSTAFQVTATRQGVITGQDALRVSLIQPLHVESGTMEYSTARIADRETGELEGSTETWRLGGERPLFAEAMYATSLIGGSTQFSVYTRAQLAGDTQAEDVSGVTAGGRIRFTF